MTHGAINGYILAMHTENEVEETIKELSKIFIKSVADFWLGLSLIKPYSMWTGGFVYGFFFQKGLYNAITIDQYIEDWFKDRPIKRHITIGVANLLNGSFDVFSEHQKT